MEMYRNREWEYRMEINGLLILLAISIFLNCWMWVKYDNEKKLNEGLENYILHQIETRTIE